MKKLVLVIFSTLLLTACSNTSSNNNENKSSSSKSSITTSKNSTTTTPKPNLNKKYPGFKLATIPDNFQGTWYQTVSIAPRLENLSLPNIQSWILWSIKKQIPT